MILLLLLAETTHSMCMIRHKSAMQNYANYSRKGWVNKLRADVCTKLFGVFFPNFGERKVFDLDDNSVRKLNRGTFAKKPLLMEKNDIKCVDEG